jgi:putative NIF3 family GTP cyclohydrolase 1 type 2
MSNVSRRDFGLMAGAAAAAVAAGTLAKAQKGTLTAGEIVDRIKKNLGVPWNDKTYRDLYHIGGPDVPVKGIATSFGGNFRVLELADKAGLNMIIPHEPTFYSDADVIEWLKDDPMYKYKIDWANKHNIVVWRIHDHWHAHKPDGIQTGWDNAIGWNKYLVEGSQIRWKLPPTTLGELAKYMAKTLNTRSARVIGDPNLPVVNVARGSHGLAQNVEAIETADCIWMSEVREYDSFEFVRDTILAGEKKGAIFISHSSGEDEGMRYFAEWSQPFLPEVPVKFIPTGDEFWSV